MRVTLLVLLALAALPLMRHRSAALRHWVLSTALLLAAITPLLGMVVPAWSVPSALIGAGPWRAPQSTGTAIADASSRVSVDIATVQATATPRPPTMADRFSERLRVVWFAGSAVCGLLLFVGIGRLWWLASSARDIVDGRRAELMREIVDQPGFRRPVRLLQSDHPSLLVTWGLFVPAIILPRVSSEWTDERMRIVLWHELAHINRGDWFTQLAADLLRAAYWFNPFVWIACRRLRQESEQACDDEVLRRGVEGTEYAEALLGLARELKHARLAGLPAPAMARSSSLERRVSAMLNTTTDRAPVGRMPRLLAVLALLLVAIPIASAQTFATFSGTVIDATGAVVPDSTMVLSNADRHSKYEVKSGPTGGFEFVGLPSGTYDLEASNIGFATFKATVAVAPGEVVQRSVALQIGSLQETIFTDDGGGPVAMDVKRNPSRSVPASACVTQATGGHIVAPKKIADTPPIFPPNLRGTGVEGTVVMDVVMGVDGAPKDIRVRDGANADLAAAAVAAVREWRYTETLLNCIPQEVQFTVRASFVHKP